MEKKNLKTIEEETKKFLELLKIKAEIETEVDKEEVVHLSLQSEDSGVLIGYHGQTLASCQLILNLIIYKKLGQWIKVILDVGDWRQKREESLKAMALKTAQRVEETGEAVALPYLTAADRRIVHLALLDHPQVVTESQGEGEERRLVVKTKA